MGFWRAAGAVLMKDLRIELATGEIVATTTFFGVLVTVLASVAFAGGDQVATRVAPGALWLPVLFAAMLALNRSWQREREESALVGLLVSPVPRASIWCGKAASLLVFLLAVEVVIVPLVALFFHVELAAVAGPLAVVLVLGTLGIATTGTLFGAMTVRTRARELLLSLVLLPLLSPALVSGVGATREIFYAAATAQAVDYGEVGDYVRFLALFDVVSIVGAASMFGALVEE